MFKRVFAISLATFVFTASLFLQSAGAQSVNLDASNARTKVENLGVGSKVEVKLRDTTRLKGHIDAIGPDSFKVVDKTGAFHDVAYADATEVKKPGGGISTKTWIILGAAAAGAVVTWIIVKPALCDGGAQTRESVD